MTKEDITLAAEATKPATPTLREVYMAALNGDFYDDPDKAVARCRALRLASEGEAHIPPDVLKYAQAMKRDGYRGPLAHAKAIIDWVANHD